MKGIIKVLSILIIIGILPSVIQACGAYCTDVYFTYAQRPEYPFESYAAGHLGIIQPTYARSYLYVAYRYLSGSSFSKEGQKALVNLWQERLGEHVPGEGMEGIKMWSDACRRVPGFLPGLNEGSSIDSHKVVKSESYYVEFLNCGNDAFVVAARTLEARIAQFGINSAEVREWTKSQDAVFLNCANPVPLPSVELSALDPLIRKDHAYQEASAQFYAGNYANAQSQFFDIASDKDSPWRDLARYLIARCMIRRAVVRSDELGPDMTVLVQADGHLRGILADAHMSPYYAAARRLLGFVEFRSNPVERAGILASWLLGSQPASELKTTLCDYTLLLDHGTRSGDDLTDWLFTIASSEPDSLDHSLDRWKTTNTLPWLISCLGKMHVPHPRLGDVMKEAAKISPGSPGYATVLFHLLRLRMEAGEAKEAIPVLEAALKNPELRLPVSSINLLRALGMKYARSMDEMLRYAARKPADIVPYNDMGECTLQPYPNEPEITNAREQKKGSYFDIDGVVMLSQRIPLEVLGSAIADGLLPPNLRVEMTKAVWVRAILLDNVVEAKEAASILGTLLPKLKNDLDSYLEAKDKPSREFAAVITMLRNPGLQPFVRDGIGRSVPIDKIQEYRDNWWFLWQNVNNCQLQQFPDEPPTVMRALYPDWKAYFPGFLSEEQKRALHEEMENLQAHNTAPMYLGPIVLDWAHQHPLDARVPEALHLTVRSTRYCPNCPVSDISRKAFELLHKKYPKSEWTKKTPNWY